MNQYIAAVHGGVSALMLIIVGYICSLFKLIPLKDFGILNLYTSKCCFFFMTFKSLAGKNKTQLDFSPLLISTLMSISLYLLIALFIFIIFPKTFFKQKQLADKHQESIKKLTNKNKNEKSNTKNNLNSNKQQENNNVLTNNEENESYNLHKTNDFSNNFNSSCSSKTPPILFEEALNHQNYNHESDHHFNKKKNNHEEQSKHIEKEEKYKKNGYKNIFFKRKKTFDTPDDKFGIFLTTAFPSVYVNYLISGLPIFLSLWDESETTVITMMLITNEIVSLPILLLLSNFRKFYLHKAIKKEFEKISVLKIKDESKTPDQEQVTSISSNKTYDNKCENRKIGSREDLSINDIADINNNSNSTNDIENIIQNPAETEINNINKTNNKNCDNLNEGKRQININQENDRQNLSNDLINSNSTGNINNSACIEIIDDSNTTQSENKNETKNEIDEKVEFSAKKILIELLSTLINNMFLVGIVFGFIYLAITSKMCTFIYHLMTLLSNCVLPFSLFSVGAYLSSQNLISCNWLVFLISIVSRLIIGPILAGVFCFALKFPGRLARQCIILTTMPTRVTCAAITENEELGIGVSSTMVLWSCVFMIPAVVLWMWILDYTHLFEN